MKKKKIVAMLIVLAAILTVVICALYAFYSSFPDIYNYISRFFMAWCMCNGIGKFVAYLFKE